MNVLRFSPGNAKLKGISSLSLLAGWSCPFADECHTKVDLTTNKIIDGPNQKFRCFSASQENIFPAVRKQRQNNFEVLRGMKTSEEMAQAIQNALPVTKKKIIRIHVSGDFFNQKYFDAWVLVANSNPDYLFYAYTKSLRFWIARLNSIPSNLKLNASYGGREDHLIEQYNLKSCLVVGSPEEANKMGLKLDKDDSHAYTGNKSFALLIHGTQKSGSEMGKAKNELRKRGIAGYQRKGKTPNKFRKTEELLIAA